MNIQKNLQYAGLAIVILTAFNLSAIPIVGGLDKLQRPY